MPRAVSSLRSRLRPCPCWYRLAAPLLAIALAGCSGSADSSSTKTIPPEFAGDPKIEEIYKSGKSDAEIRKAVIAEVKSRGRPDAGKAKGRAMQ